MTRNKGFLIMEVLIACLILTSAIAAGMYLFRTGFDYLDRANVSNVMSSKLPQTINVIRASDLRTKSGTENMGDGVTLEWTATMLDDTKPSGVSQLGMNTPGIFEVYLYRVHINLNYKKKSREYDLNVLRHKRLWSPEASEKQGLHPY